MNYLPSISIDDLPWSCEAEQSVLGALLIDNDAYNVVSPLLREESFWHPPHRVLFATMQQLLRAGKPADVVTVFDALGDERAEFVGGLKYLTELAQSVPSARNVRQYAEIVGDKALRREILGAVDDAFRVVQDSVSADEALDRVQTLLARVKRVNPSAAPRAIGELMAARVTHWERLEAGDEAPGIPTGLAPLDEALGGGIKPGKVIVLAARPSVGKTSLATQILLHIGAQGQRGLMLSQEMTAGELMDRAASHLGAIRMDHLAAGRLAPEDWARVAELSDRTASMPVYIDDQAALSLLDIRAKARHVQRQGGLSLLVVDYLQLCSSAAGTDKRHHQIEQISRGIKALAKELGVCVLLLSQLNRASEGGEPELQHLKESGSIEEDADVAILLHPMGHESDGSMLVLAKVAKNRGGRRGRLALSFDGRTQRWAPSAGNVSRRGAVA